MQGWELARPFAKPRADRRLAAAAPVAIRARYDAAQTPAGDAKHWANADSLSPDAAHSPGVREILRERSRYEEGNNGLCNRMVRTQSVDRTLYRRAFGWQVVRQGSDNNPINALCALSEEDRRNSLIAALRHNSFTPRELRDDALLRDPARSPSKCPAGWKRWVMRSARLPIGRDRWRGEAFLVQGVPRKQAGASRIPMPRCWTSRANRRVLAQEVLP